MLDCKEPGKDAGSGKEIITLVYNKQANDSDILQALDSFKSLICNRVEILPLKRYHYLKAWYEMLTGPYSPLPNPTPASVSDFILSIFSIPSQRRTGEYIQRDTLIKRVEELFND